MRLMPVEYLKEGDIIAKDIINYEGGVLLRYNTKFKDSYRNKLIERNVLEVYIEDDISKGIEPVEIIARAAKKRMTEDIQSQFGRLKDSMELNVENLEEITAFLINELSSKEMLLELEDLKANDSYTYEHCIAVAILTSLVCSKMNISEEKKEKIVMGALIHDIGKIIVPKDILNKPGRLTPEEYEVIKMHPEIGYKMIKDHPEISPITKVAVLCHHEREDGSGYPLGKGKELHIGAKIVAGCDLYHALISDRCYRRGVSIEQAIKIGREEPIDSEVRSIIESCFSYYPIGCVVSLNNGQIGIVEKNNENNPARPVLRIIIKEDDKLKVVRTMDLQEEKDFYIVGRYNEEI